jgi:nucleoside phosphorylase
LADRKLHIFAPTAAEAGAVRAVAGNVPVHVIGIRAAHLPDSLESESLVLIGFAGALDPMLAIGDIVTDDPPGSLYTADQLIATPAEKARLRLATSARAVEMEGAIVRRFAERIGARFVHIRAISDRADQSLDIRFLQMIDDAGRLRPAALAKLLIRNPSIVPPLLRLALQTRAAARSLRLALREFLHSQSQR